MFFWWIRCHTPLFSFFFILFHGINALQLQVYFWLPVCVFSFATLSVSICSIHLLVHPSFSAPWFFFICLILIPFLNVQLVFFKLFFKLCLYLATLYGKDLGFAASGTICVLSLADSLLDFLLIAGSLIVNGFIFTLMFKYYYKWYIVETCTEQRKHAWNIACLPGFTKYVRSVTPYCNMYNKTRNNKDTI